MRPDKDSNSNFASPGGAAVLFLLFLAASYSGAAGLSVFLFLIFCIMLGAWIWGRYSLENLTAELPGGTRRTFPGEPVTCVCRLKNQKWLPLLWLSVRFPAEMDLPGGEAEQRMHGVLPFQKLEWPITLPVSRRGIWYLNRLLVMSGDALGLAVTERSVKADPAVMLVVYPEIVPVRTDELPLSFTELDQGAQGWMEDRTLLKNIRRYQPGDSMKKINWRMLARQGELSVNLYETILPRTVTFILDLESFSGTEGTPERTTEGTTEGITEGTAEGTTEGTTESADGSAEEMISLTASLLLRFSEKQIRCGLVWGSKILRPGEGENAAEELLTALAGISLKEEKALLPPAEWGRLSGAAGQVFVMAQDHLSGRCLTVLASLPEQQICVVLHHKSERSEILGKMNWNLRERRQLLE